MPLKLIRKVAQLALAEKGSVKTLVVRSGIWVGISQVIGAGLNVLRSIMLARLLTPEAFGVMGLASVAIRAIETVTRPGVAQALIARTAAFEEAAGTAFSMLLMRGVLLAGVLAAMAPMVAEFYDTASLQPILQVLSVVFVIGSLNNINAIARQKEMDFRRLTLLNLTATATGTILTIVAAFWLRNVWALVVGQIATVSLNTLLSYYFIGGRLRVSWNPNIARELLRYGKFITGSSVVLFIASELDSIVIGKILGVEQLGFYTLAATVATLPTANISRVASSIMLPAYSKLQADFPSLRNAFLRTLGLVMFIVVPASVALMLLAEPLILVVYGERWLPAVAPVQVLAAFGLVRALASFNGYLFEGMGRPGVAFQLGVLRLLVIVPLIIWLTGRSGLSGAAIAVLVGISVQWLAGLGYLRRILGISPLRVAAAMGRPLATTAVMATAMVLLDLVFELRNLPGLVCAVATGLAVYISLNLRMLQTLRKELIR